MITLTGTPLADITRPNYSINATIGAVGESDEVQIETVTGVSTIAEVGDIEHNDLIITNGLSSTLTGEVTDPFSDVFHFVDQDFANNPGYETHQDEQEVIGISNMPPEKMLYELVQDQAPVKTITFTVTVTYDITDAVTSDPITTGATQVFSVTQNINNSWEGMKAFMENYY